MNRLVALGMLRKLGLRADAVANGAEAVKALTELPYDLVLMDVQMPEMDGMEATRVIRDPQSSVRNHAIPIIAMTAHAMQGDRERCLQAGMNGYLAKPVRPEALAGALEEWLPREPRGSDTAGLDTPAALPSEAAGGSEAPIFDRAGLMDRAMDDEELAQVVIGAFLEDTPKQIEALSGYISAGDLAGAGRQAHTIGGAAANAGGEALCRVAFAMEAASETGSLEDIAMRMPDLEREFGRLRQAMEQAGYRAPGTEGDGR